MRFRKILGWAKSDISRDVDFLDMVTIAFLRVLLQQSRLLPSFSSIIRL